MQLSEVVDLPGEGTPICVISGFGGGLHAYQRLLQALNQRGHRVIWVPFLREGGNHSRDEHASFSLLALQAEHILATLRERGVKQMIVLGHSMGGAVGTVLADLAPDMVVRMVYVCSACLYPDTPWHLTWRMTKKLVADLRHARTLRGQEKAHWKLVKTEAVAYVRANLRRAIKEGWLLGNFQVLSLLHRLGVDAFFIAGAQDPLFLAHRQRAALAHAFDNHFVVINVHHDPQLRPSETTLLVETLARYHLLDPQREA